MRSSLSRSLLAMGLLAAGSGIGTSGCSKDPQTSTTVPAATSSQSQPPAATPPEAPPAGQALRPSSSNPSAATTLTPANSTFTEFQQQLSDYLALRKKVESSLPKVTETQDPRKIAERSAALAKGLQEARAGLKQGNTFSPAVAKEFRRILAEDAKARTATDRTDIMDEVPTKMPEVNGLYPTDSPQGPTALASFPAALLKVLPDLPETIEYRFLAHSLVLRDAVANVIVDYLPDVAPAPPGGGMGESPAPPAPAPTTRGGR
jgi:hypothetical protein